jgi:hypothetical protein
MSEYLNIHGVVLTGIGLLILFSGISLGKRSGSSEAEGCLTVCGLALSIVGAFVLFVWFIVTYTDGATQ